jgi:hypothetical protein
MVIGDDHESQLAPFHEFECTGWNDQYIQDIEITDDVKQHIRENPTQALEDSLDYYGVTHIISPDELPDYDGDAKWGYAVATRDGELIRAVRRTNPDARWDWYVVGGRWSGVYGKDVFYKRDLDLDALTTKASVEALARWPDYCDSYPDSTLTREEYITLHTNRSLIPYAYIKDHAWHGKGEMGWWGMTRGDMRDEKWHEQFWSMLAALPDDTLITIVDCHI